MAKSKTIETPAPKYVPPEPVRKPVEQRAWWVTALLVLVALGLIIWFWRYLFPPASAQATDKILWCHKTPSGQEIQLNLPQPALESAGHVDAGGNPLHAGDYKGECEGEPAQKSVVVIQDCNGTEDVTVYGGSTRRTWRVNGVEKWVDYNEEVTWNDVPLNSSVEWWHEASQQWKDSTIENYYQVIKATDCEVCEQTEWSCQDCQSLVDNVCYKDQENYCGEAYNCYWQGCEPNGSDKLAVCEPNWVCETVCEEPTPTPTPTPPPATTRTSEAPSGCTENCGVPACTDTVPKAVANPHVYRNGDTALVKWMPTEGDKVNIYWRLNSSNEWQHAISNSPNDGYEEIKGLNNYDWTFGVQSVNGCAADGIVNASNISEIVDGDTDTWVLFR